MAYSATRSGQTLSESWYDENQKLHRVDGPALVDNDIKEWFFHGKRHRTDGPAIEWEDGSKEWWNHGKLHRIDGPATDFVAPAQKGWWLFGFRYETEKEYLAARDILCWLQLTDMNETFNE